MILPLSTRLCPYLITYFYNKLKSTINSNALIFHFYIKVISWIKYLSNQNLMSLHFINVMNNWNCITFKK